MKTGEFCNRETVICGRETTIREAARLMRRHHVGDIVVTERRDGQAVPVGILTDRDIVVGLLAEEQIDLDILLAGDVMSYELVTADEDDDLMQTVKQMRRHGIRRMPVIDAQGALVGILALDDLLELLAEQIDDLVNLVVNQRRNESRRRE